MKDSVIGTAVVHEICPICGKTMNEQIVMNRHLSMKAAREVNELNGKAIGYSKNACEECTKYKDEVVYIIGVDPKRSEENNPYRTGQIVGIKNTCDFILDNYKYINKTANGVCFMFMEENVGIKIGIFQKQD